MSDASLQQLRQVHQSMKTELAAVIVGQDQVIDQILLAILTRGHCLLVGVPGLAKTLMISSLARTLDLQFSRIQFTPDLMPSDITGTDLLQIDPVTNARSFRFAPGPLFANVVLADEINRTPPKTQAALLEAMVERQVTCGGVRHELPNPFFVLATQNPIEQEGTYPLPEAQLDRFMFQVQVGYPSAQEEREILRRTTGGEVREPQRVVSAAELLEAQKTVRSVQIADSMYDYILALTQCCATAS
jgi:MoxR-like ATPase